MSRRVILDDDLSTQDTHDVWQRFRMSSEVRLGAGLIRQSLHGRHSAGTTPRTILRAANRHGLNELFGM